MSEVLETGTPGLHFLGLMRYHSIMRKIDSFFIFLLMSSHFILISEYSFATEKQLSVDVPSISARKMSCAARVHFENVRPQAYGDAFDTLQPCARNLSAQYL